MERLLEKKICLVTGAGRGIGRVIAAQLAADGATVYAADLDMGDMEGWAAQTSAENNTRVIPIIMDVTDTAAVKSGLMNIHKTEGRIDVVVNNAAIIQNQKLGMVTKALMEKMFAVNVFAVIDIMQLVSRLMARTGGGSIVNIASVTAVVGSPGQVAYSSSKGAVIAATKSAAKELSPMQIRVNAVAPGIIRTERFEELYEASSDKIDQRISRIALGRLGTPQDVANAVAFLASDRASYISGHILGVDGCASI